MANNAAASSDATYSIGIPIGKDSRLRIFFCRVADRFQHRIQVLIDGTWLTLLRSIEGGIHPWPPSPPLQQLTIETRDRGDVALAVGMAGNSHWASSIETRPDANSIVFDLACRLKQRPEQLGSTYEVAETAQVRRENCGASLLMTTPELDSSVRLKCTGETALDIAQQHVELTVDKDPCDPNSSPFAEKTVCWSYQFDVI